MSEQVTANEALTLPLAGMVTARVAPPLTAQLPPTFVSVTVWGPEMIPVMVIASLARACARQ